MNVNYKNILNGTSDRELLTLYERLSETYTEQNIQNIYDEAGVGDLTRNCCGFVEKIAKLPFLGEAAVNINLFCGMLMDSIKKDYHITAKTKGIIVGALVYLMMPVDLVPDAIPILGMLDDARVLILAARALESELAVYKEYLLEKDSESFAESLKAVVSERFFGEQDELNCDSRNEEVA